MDAKLIFLCAVIVTALIALAFVLHLRWNVRESNATLINSAGVREFIMTGFAISCGTALAEFSGNELVVINGGVLGRVGFYGVTLVSGAIVWAVLHVIGAVWSRRQRGI